MDACCDMARFNPHWVCPFRLQCCVCECGCQRGQTEWVWGYWGWTSGQSNRTAAPHCVCHAWSTLITVVLAQQAHKHDHRSRISYCIHTLTHTHLNAHTSCEIICLHYKGDFCPTPPASSSLHENWHQAVIAYCTSSEWHYNTHTRTNTHTHTRRNKGPMKLREINPQFLVRKRKLKLMILF